MLLKLFWSFFQIGAFSFGGGMAAIPLIQHQVTEVYCWLGLTEFTELIAIAGMTPGSIAINSAIFVGIRIAGFPGAAAAAIGCILPSCVIVSLLSYAYSKYKDVHIIQGILSGLKPAVVALIASASLTIFISSLEEGDGFLSLVSGTNLVSFILVGAAFFILRKWKPNPLFVILGSGILSGIIYLVQSI